MRPAFIVRFLVDYLCGLPKLVRRNLGIGIHMTMSIENTARMDDQKSGVNVASEAAGRVDLSSAASFDIPKYLSVNFDFAHADVCMNHSIAAHDQGLTAVDGTVKATVNPDHA